MKDGQREGAVKCDSEQTGFSKIGNTKESGELQSKSFTNSGESSRRILEERGEKMKKEETNDIIQFFIPILKEVKIDIQNCKIDVTTEKSGNKRGDIWISNTKHGNKDFEKNIIALVEAKHRNCMIGDIDWRDAMKQGKEKSLKQRLNYYIVTNSKTEIRFYNSQTDEEILLDGKFITKMMGEEVLIKIQTQVKKDNSEVIYKSKKEIKHVSENKFRNTLKQLAEIYRSAGLKKGDERIDPTVSFVVLKYISEKE